MAILAVDHPLVDGAVADVTARGTRVFTLLPDITTLARTADLVLDSRKAGRTAVRTIARLAKVPGKVGILLASHRILSQEMSEMSFRSFMREHQPQS